MEKSISFPKKKLGVSKKYKIDNYRFERYKPFKESNTGCVQISFFAKVNAYKSSYALHRALCRHWKESIEGYEEGVGKQVFFVPSFGDSICDKNTKSFIQIDVQFTKENLSPFMNEMIYDLVEDALIDAIERSSLEVV